MTDAPEQAQAAEAPETAAADNAAAQENSAPEQNPQPQQKPEIKSLSDLDQLADQVLAEEAGEKEAAPAQKESEAKPEEKPEEQQQQAESKPPVDRVRLTSLKDGDKALVNTAVQMVKDGLAESIPDAIGKLTARPMQEKPAGQTEQAEPEQVVDPVAQSIEAKQAEIAEVLKELTQAKKDFDDEKETALTDKLTDLKTDIKFLKFRQEQIAEAEARRQQDEAAGAYGQEYDTYRDQAISLYPDAAVEGSDLFNQIQADVAEYEKKNPAIFESPDYPMLIAGKAAAKLGIAPKFANQAAKPAAATSSPSAKVAARPANPMVGGNATTVSSDIKSAVRQVESIRSLNDLNALAEAAL